MLVSVLERFLAHIYSMYTLIHNVYGRERGPGAGGEANWAC